QPFGVARTDRDPATLSRERGRRPAPESLRGGGDERNLAVDPQVHGGRCYPWGATLGPAVDRASTGKGMARAQAQRGGSPRVARAGGRVHAHEDVGRTAARPEDRERPEE